MPSGSNREGQCRDVADTEALAARKVEWVRCRTAGMSAREADEAANAKYMAVYEAAFAECAAGGS